MSIDLGRPRRLYFVGLGGMGMSALARYLRAQGHAVAGSDQAESPVLADLRREGIAAAAGHDPARLAASGAEAVIVSAAIRSDNPELRAARAAGLPVLTLAEAVGLVAAGRRVLAVAGTHGKTTTTSMIAYALDRAGRAPSFLLGGLAPDLGGNARFGASDLLVIEADEYAGRFLTLHPAVAAVTNLELDHPDVYPDWASLEAVFRRWLAQVQPGGLVLLRADDPGCARLGAALALAAGVRRASFALAPAAADWTAEPLPPDPAGDPAIVQRARLRRDGVAVAELALRLPAPYDLLNALAAVAVCAEVGLTPAAAAAHLAGFGGVGRRFERRGVAAGVTVIDDYAHHPTALRLVLGTARARYPGARLWCLFQPHTYSRTRQFFDDFAAALRGADVAVVLPVYAAREPDDPALTPARLAAAAGPLARPVASLAEAVALVAAAARPGDVVLTVGAGDITDAGPRILAALAAGERAAGPAA
jgi:UDP-N-acetylmuramate--alanine ligase